MKPIPRRLLPHQAKYKKYLGNTGEGDEWGEEITLNYVKVDDSKKITLSQNGREIIGNAMLFYDFNNSDGLLEEPTINSLIIFNNKTYHIESVNSLYANSIVHHYEILLK